MKVPILIGCYFVLMMIMLFNKKTVALSFDNLATAYPINNGTEAHISTSNVPVELLTEELKADTDDSFLSIGDDSNLESFSLLSDLCNQITTVKSLTSTPNKKTAFATAKYCQIINKNKSQGELKNASEEINLKMELSSLKLIATAEESLSPKKNVANSVLKPKYLLEKDIKDALVFIPTTRKPIRPPGRTGKATVITATSIHHAK